MFWNTRILHRQFLPWPWSWKFVQGHCTSFTHESSLGYTWARIRLFLTFRHPQNGTLIQVHVAYKTLLHVHVKYTLNK